MPLLSIESSWNKPPSAHCARGRARRRLNDRTWTYVLPLIVAVSAGFMICTTPASAEPPALQKVQLVRVRVLDADAVEKLREFEAADRRVEIWSERVIDGRIDVRVPVELVSWLDALGLTYEVVVQDVEAHRAALFSASEGAGFFDSYRTHLEHIDFLVALAASHPDLATVLQIGTSVQSRPIVAIRITAGAGDEPTVFYHGAQHGNEIMSPAVLAYLAQQLLNDYGSDAAITDLVDNAKWLILPISNPDGYEVGDRYNANGVDLNRDWSMPEIATRFTQPETQAIRDLLADHDNISAHVDLHSSGNAIFWPWGYTYDLTVDHLTFKRLGDALAEEIASYRGTVYGWRGQTFRTIYPVHGGSVDYSYAAFKTWGLVFELGYSQGPPTSEILPTCEEIGRALRRLSAWVLDCDDDGVLDAQVLADGLDTDCNANRTPDACESNIDADDWIDGCDPDADDDGWATEYDSCPFRPVGGPARENGFPAYDMDEDCGVSVSDYYVIANQGCWIRGGPGEPVGRWCEQIIDTDGDLDADLKDFAVFQRAFDPSTGE